MSVRMVSSRKKGEEGTVQDAGDESVACSGTAQRRERHALTSAAAATATREPRRYKRRGGTKREN
jgi:hypothetical protein